MSTTITYTDQQANAIGASGVSLALDAGAGCGKTFVLTERYLKELARHDPERPDTRLSQLVAITFTDAAARELRTRIRKLVYDKIATTVGDERRNWLQLQRAIDTCRISTIHALCGNLLRQNAFTMGLDPMFSTLDGPSAAVLEAQAIEDTLRELLTTRDPDTMTLGRAWNVDGAQKRVRTMMGECRKPGFEAWLRREPEDLLAAWEDFVQTEVWPQQLAVLRPVAEALLPLVESVTPKKLEQEEPLATVTRGLQGVVSGNAEYGAVVAARKLAVANRVPFTKTFWGSDDEYEEYKRLSGEFRELVDKIPALDVSGPAAREAAELGLALARVTMKASVNYQQAKEQLGALDFEDLLVLTHRLLTDPRHRAIQRELREQIAVLFVDEFQDTDRVQVDMVRSLVGDIAESGKLFFVGDDKQSIYRFRGAEPQVFRDLQQEIEEQWRLPLSHNFRSQPAVLHFVNALFHQVFENYQPLVPTRPQATAEPAIEFLWTAFPKPESGSTAGHAARSRQAEARHLAARLRTIIDSREPIIGDKRSPDGRRPAEFGDVAILFRVLSDIAYYEEALRAEEIPYYLVGGHAFYAQQEVYDVLHLLRAVASECDELSLAGVLRSPFFSVADETLFWLAIHHHGLENGLFAGEIPREIDEAERAKVMRAEQTLTFLRSKKDEWTVPQILSEAMERTGYDAALLADFMGERKLANVYKLMEQARAAVTSGVGSLDDFVTQLAEFTTTTPKEALATTSPGDANVVRLMTVHKSKGLEFPLVVVPDLDRPENNARDSVAFDARLGPLVGPANEFDDLKQSGWGMKLFRHLETLAEKAESDRLFYVACTRAADYLMLSSAIDDIDNPKGPWLKRLAETFDLETGELLPSTSIDHQQRPRVAATIDKAPNAKPFAAGHSTDWLKTLEKAKREKRDVTTEQFASPITTSSTARRRYSVTRLSGQIIPTGGDWWRDDAENMETMAVADYEYKIDALGLGTLVHAMLERFDLADPSTIAKWAKSLAPHHDILHADTAASIATDLVEAFAASERAESLRAASEVHHEVEFTLTWPLATSEGNPRYLQGYLDCLYRDADGWRVVDYKTNQVSAAGVPELAKKYELQMLVYGLAVEQTWGTAPKELVLHFLRPGVEYVFAWDDAMRQRAIELVSTALQQIETQTT
ncbi:UvrD-helicase domain-containing protein [Aeoliella sp. SH292]|uniref:UvrD-helicase domain-containing protein n=1 Tax=Aeoliella sp. SH292 TaxID=3454464 RepID=UPI003F9D2223